VKKVEAFFLKNHVTRGHAQIKYPFFGNFNPTPPLLTNMDILMTPLNNCVDIFVTSLLSNYYFFDQHFFGKSYVIIMAKIFIILVENCGRKGYTEI
jgi:hypothetical protein